MINMVYCYGMHRYIDRQNKIETPEISLSTYYQFVTGILETVILLPLNIYLEVVLLVGMFLIFAGTSILFFMITLTIHIHSYQQCVKVPQCLVVDEWIKKTWQCKTHVCIRNAILFDNLKKDILPCAPIKDLMLSEINQILKNKHCMISHI